MGKLRLEAVSKKLQHHHPWVEQEHQPYLSRRG
jgi:hypothetical protein